MGTYSVRPLFLAFDPATCPIHRLIRWSRYYHLGPVLSAVETQALLEVAERKLADPYKDYEKLPRMFEYDLAARDLIVREPFPSLAEAILGPECHMMSQNWLSTTQAEGQKRVEQIEGGGGWHVDDLLQFPLPEHVEAHSLDAPPPIFIISLFVLLTDVDSIENGCTCFVP